MWKLIGIVALAIGAGMGIPEIRAKLAPHVGRLLAPVAEKAGDPLKKWSAKNEVKALLHKLSLEDARGRPLPSPLDFQMWVRTNTKAGKRGLDPWDRPYYLLTAPRRITVGSAGPDRKRNTRDDIRVSAALN